MAPRSSPIITGIDARSPKSQPKEHPADSEDGWRPADDDELQGLSTSSMHQNMQESCHTDDLDCHSYEMTYKPARAKSTEPSSHPPQTTVSLLTRPESSHEDPAAGFSFSKAKPLQPLDFSRKITSNAILPSNAIVSLAYKQDVQSDSNNTQNTGTNYATASLVEHTGSPRTPPQENVAPKKPFAVPFPNVAAKTFESSNCSGSGPTNVQHGRQPLSTMPAAIEASMSGDDTLGEPDPQNISSTRENESLNDLKKSSSAVSVSHSAPHGYTRTTLDQQGNTHRNADACSDIPEGPVHVLPKATKARRKAGTAPDQVSGSLSSSRNVLPPEGDLLQMLLYKHKQNSREREKLQQTLQAKEAEYQELYAASEDLYAQLHEMSQHCKANEGQLVEIRQAQSGWKKRVSKLNDYVKGLTNDHNKLRDDAEEIRKRQSSVLEDKESILETLREVNKVTEQRQFISKQLVIEARHDVQMLNQKMGHQETKLREGEIQLSSEREHNVRLQEQVATFTVNKIEFLENYKADRDSITKRLAELLHKVDEVQCAAFQASQDDSRPMLERCVSMIKELPPLSDGIKPADLQKLNDSINGQLKKSLGLVTNCEQNTTEIKHQQQRLESSIQEQLHTLESNVATQHTLFEQTMDLREVKATVTQRLHGTEAALQEARVELSRLRQKDTEQSAKLIALEDSSKIRQPAEDPMTILRLQELDALNKDIQKDLTNKLSETEALHEKLRENEEDTQKLKEQMSEAQATLAEAYKQVEAAHQEKAQCQQFAVQEQEKMRQLLSKAADRELEDLKSKHLNELQQLEAKKSPMAERVKEAYLQLVTMKNENEQLKSEAADANAAIESEKKQREDRAALANELRHRVNELGLQSHGKDLALETLRKLLEDTQRDNLAKDSYIRKIRKAFTKKSTSSPSTRDINTARGSRVRPPAVVEDSQLNGYPYFASHEDTLSENGGSQVLGTDENLSSLFPTTPKGQNHDVEVSCMTYSSTRVSSRDGIDILEQARSQQGPPRKAPSRSGSQANTPSNGRLTPSLAGGRSQSSIPAPQSECSKSPTNASHAQHSSQVLGPVPRGILKPTTQNAQGEKRKASEPEANNPAGFTAPKKRKSDMTRDLGPIVEDSQSLVNVISSRARKQTLPRRPRKEDKFSRAFAEHLP